MKVVIQRVSQASVMIDGAVHNEINQGFVVLLGIGQTDDDQDINYLAQKILGLRVFSDHEGKMNHSLDDVKGEILLISQFTLFADTSNGRRPTWQQAARGPQAEPLVENVVTALRDLGARVETGKFGADMRISAVCDGPMTVTLEV